MSDPESHATPHEQPIMRGEKLSYKEASLEKGRHVYTQRPFIHLYNIIAYLKKKSSIKISFIKAVATNVMPN
jgi:hypothetical protein